MMALGKHGRDVLICVSAAIGIVMLAWIVLLFSHPSSRFDLDIKLQFAVPD